jgi:hypothetical protein
VGGGGASKALDRGWEATEAAVDDEQELGKKEGSANVGAGMQEGVH